ncbi:hypothetical protein GOV05_00950 [Candidatus Woesearchaeota archaeon]|nr:hypothetical protein [Candidatus Woesearchaeota archaeon]
MKVFEQEFLEFLEGVYKSFGFDTLSAKLYSTLFLEPSDVSMEDLSKRTGYSLASISNKMKLMEGVGVAKRIKKPGSKKVYYFVEKDMIKIQFQKMKALSEKMFEPTKELLPKIANINKKEKLSTSDKEKVKIIKKFYEQMLQMEKAMEKFLEALEK